MAVVVARPKPSLTVACDGVGAAIAVSPPVLRTASASPLAPALSFFLLSWTENGS
jgi:hypothetical protein